MVSKILCILSPGVERPMPLNGPYHKEQEYIWFMGGDLNGFQDNKHFMK